MSQKIERPTLTGQRIKTRKRDEKEKFDPAGFRDSILQGFVNLQKQTPSPTSDDVNLNDKQLEKLSLQDKQSLESEQSDDTHSANDTSSPANGVNNGTHDTCSITKTQLENLSKFLDTSGSKLDYRRYGEVLFDVLIAGGHLAPGGVIVVDSNPLKVCKTDLCVFTVHVDDVEMLRAFAQVFVKLIRRYMYLEKTLEEEFKKLITFLKGFNADERMKLAKITGLLVSGGQLPANVLTSALQDHFIKDGLAIDFLVTVFQSWLLEKDPATIWGAVKKSGLETRIMDFLPFNKRTPEHLSTVFVNGDLDQLLSYQKASLNSMLKKELQNQVYKLIKDESTPKEIISFVNEFLSKNEINENEVVVLLWNALMSSVEWNKKEELVAEQALKHLKGYTPLLAKFTTTGKAELMLIIRIQEFCYENMNFLKVFRKIIMLFYNANVLSEDVIMKWYKESHSTKGKSIFLEQMKKFIEWLENAEEESDGDD